MPRLDPASAYNRPLLFYAEAQTFNETKFYFILI